ncbi:zinc chelation protein SecC [Clostridium polyendosporum]|uniref:Zinc chelation protein SecC n=1 Tax=Clostridium polyendosporum TaxID=69208 RepID=A0A919S0Y0_9CLOT|nr:SEC-C metal-binding domain-containing protein [Clostridium polyendosporum]GIM28598.1 zinc chelation protein SecC [Clostridium polyendosporum]
MSLLEKDLNKLVNALEMGKNFSQLQIQSDYEKMFKDNLAELDSVSLMNQLSKNDLDKIRKYLEIRGKSSLRKAELIVALSKYIMDNTSEILMNTLDVEQLKFIRCILKNNGRINYIRTEKNDEIINSLRILGIIYPIRHEMGCKQLIIPNNFIDVIDKTLKNKDIISKIYKNDRIYNLARGLINIYGIVPFNILNQKIYNIIGEELEVNYLFNTLWKYNERSTFFRWHENQYFVSIQVFDVNNILKEQFERIEIQYKDFDEKAIISASKNKYSVWNEWYKSMYSFLINFPNITEEFAVEFINDISNMLKNNFSIFDIVNTCSQKIVFNNEDKLKKFVGLLTDVASNCNLWILKGHTPNEIYNVEKEASSTAIIKREKIGRNQPCTCGSNKKYKRCCGRG